MTTFNIWLRLQRNSFQRLGLQTVFKRPWENAWSRWVEKLPAGLSKREPFYRAYRCLEPLFFLQLATPSAVTLWPWLSGSAHIDFFALGFNLAALITLLLSWKYVKASNRAAAEVLQREIDSAAA